MVLRTAVVCMGRRVFCFFLEKCRYEVTNKPRYWSLEGSELWIDVFCLSGGWIPSGCSKSSWVPLTKRFFFWTFSMQSCNFCFYMFHIFSLFFQRIPLLEHHWIRDVFVELPLSFCACQVLLLNGRTSKHFNQRSCRIGRLYSPYLPQDLASHDWSEQKNNQLDEIPKYEVHACETWTSTQTKPKQFKNPLI